MARPLSDRDRARLAKLLNQMTSDMSDAGNAVHHVLTLVKQYGLEHQWEQVLAGPVSVAHDMSGLGSTRSVR